MLARGARLLLLPARGVVEVELRERAHQHRVALDAGVLQQLGRESDAAGLIEGEILRLKLVEAQIKATLTQTKDGPRLFVFARDEKIARTVLKS